MRTVVCAAAAALLLCPSATVGQDDAPDTAERLRGEDPRPAPRSRWGVDAPPAKKGKLIRAETAPLPDLGVMQEVPLMGGRRHFYGRGCAAVDVNGDGHEDIYLANGDNAGAQELFGKADCSSRLYLSRGSTGEFVDVPVEPNDKYAQGTAVPLGIEPNATEAQWGQCFFDMDNDGDQDVVILPGGYEAPFQLRLYENVGAGKGDHGGYFRDTTAAAGLAGPRFRQFWWGASAADYDNDGLLDLALTPLNALVNYRMHIDGRGRDPDPTFVVPRDRIFLLHNQGDGSFVEESAAVGVFIGSPTLGEDAGLSETKNPTWLDVDNNGWLDLYVAGSPHFLFENQGISSTGAFQGFADVTHSRILSPSHADKLVFSASAADFDQDGREDLFLGYWDSGGSDILLRNSDAGVLGGKNGEGGWRVGGVSKSLHVRIQTEDVAQHQKTSQFGVTKRDVYENTMGLVVGDLNDDGFPDAFVGTGTPAWSEHDLLWLNSGHEQDDNKMAPSVERWRGFEKHIIGHNTENKYAKTPKTHGHGAAFADFDRNWHTDLLLNPGGFALTDTLLADLWKEDKGKKYRCEKRGGPGICDSREMPVIYMRSAAGAANGQSLPANNMASVSLEGVHSNRDAVGAHVTLLRDPDAAPGDSEFSMRHWWIHSTNGFGSQNSKWLMLPLGGSEQREVEVTWPRGYVSRHTVSAWQREVLREPEAAGSRPHYGTGPDGKRPELRSRDPAQHVADRLLIAENRDLKKHLYERTGKQDLR